MNICTKCGYKVISNVMFERHLKTHGIDVTQPSVPTVTAEPVKTEPVVTEPAKAVVFHEEAKPVVFHRDEITLKFSKPVEVYINGKAYLGKEIVVKDMSLASEIVRICRDAYGPSILV